MVRPTDTLLHRDSTGDALYAAPPQGKHGTLIFIRPGEGEMYLPTNAVEVLHAVLQGEDLAPTCAYCGHLAAAHADDGETDCTASGAKQPCRCQYFIPMGA